MGTSCNVSSRMQMGAWDLGCTSRETLGVRLQAQAWDVAAGFRNGRQPLGLFGGSSGRAGIAPCRAQPCSRRGSLAGKLCLPPGRWAPGPLES